MADSSKTNTFTFISWNVNGLRAVIKKGFADFLKHYQPDVIGLQEIKISESDIGKFNKKFSAQGGPASGWDFVDYREYWHPAVRPGYAGTAVLTKLAPLAVSQGFPFAEDKEGRVQTLEFEKYYFLNCYFPNANHTLSRLSFKEEFNRNFLEYIKRLEHKKPVIAGGDFNVAREEIDLARPKENIGHPGFTDEERYWADQFVKHGLVDTFRRLYPNKVQYSWWSYRSLARERDIGWRIDYFFVSRSLLDQVTDAFILSGVGGSDHCPVGLTLKR
ncbi:MAG: exodeoxyribonuclease III [Candidatus Vogelbacteria bacterium]|nr:exodeoxyribonuclease III [Candidatus Vogelbacteria bacterium]